jgi:hypothetical protein
MKSIRVFPNPRWVLCLFASAVSCGHEPRQTITLDNNRAQFVSFNGLPYSAAHLTGTLAVPSRQSRVFTLGADFSGVNAVEDLLALASLSRSPLRPDENWLATQVFVLLEPASSFRPLTSQLDTTAELRLLDGPGGSPVSTVGVDLIFRPFNLETSPASWTLKATDAPASVDLQLTPPDSTLLIQPYAFAEWLSISRPNESTVRLTADPSKAPQGSSTAQLLDGNNAALSNSIQLVVSGR